MRSVRRTVSSCRSGWRRHLQQSRSKSSSAPAHTSSSGTNGRPESNAVYARNSGLCAAAGEAGVLSRAARWRGSSGSSGSCSPTRHRISGTAEGRGRLARVPAARSAADAPHVAGLRRRPQRPAGTLAIIAFNHLFPPFDNVKLRRALLPAIDQKEYVTAWVGEQQDLGKYPVGFFTANSPMSNDAGIAAFTAQRDLERARSWWPRAATRARRSS